MKREWSGNQLKAINARGSQILVSAAAGSGKTAVLSERVKNLIVADKCPVNELLVVTFTKAAAEEMRDRIYKAVEACAGDDSDYIYNQLCLLPAADICTIDSFCAKVVRENFSEAGVSADFQVLDGNDDIQLINETVDEVLEKSYAENMKEFSLLSDMYLAERDDKPLADVIKRLYVFSRSFPSAEHWLDSLCESYSPCNELTDTPFADVVFKYVTLYADYNLQHIKKIHSLLVSETGFDPNFVNNFSLWNDYFSDVLRCTATRDWNGMCALLGSKPNSTPFKNSKLDERQIALKKKALAVRDDADKFCAAFSGGALPSQAEYEADCEKLYPIVKVLCETVKKFAVLLEEKKKSLNAYSFDDIMHRCIDLLVEYDGTKFKKKRVAVELSQKYSHILIDEYQDTNEAQNMIFEAISRDKENLFFVGDVKQSIYSFRLANPDLFIKLRKSLPDYDEKTVRASQITLEKNYRSRKGITDCVNFIFSHIMSPAVGEIEYNEREYLHFEAKYPVKNTPDIDVLCIDCGKNNAKQRAFDEARAVAKYIYETVKSGAPVKDGEKIDENGVPAARPVRYGDFAILMRSTKDKSKIYADALNAMGIPVESVSDENVGDAKEVMLFASLIRAVNNPKNDVALCAVMLSPLFGFLPDELAQMKIGNKKTDVFTLLNRNAAGSEKITAFLAKLRLYRSVAAAYPIAEFVEFVADDTGIEDVFAAADNGSERRGNINVFFKFAEDFSKNGRNGLNAFVRYMDNAFENGDVKSCAAATSVADSVKIMTIHKSKGLEFPYVILADLSKKRNTRDAYKQFTISRETGIGVMVRNSETVQRYDSLGSYATEKAVQFSSISEELRVLYVAATRARENLVFVFSVNKTIARFVGKCADFDFAGGRIHPFAVFKTENISDILLSIFARHENCDVIREMADLKLLECEKTDFAVNAPYIDNDAAEELETSEQKFTALPDEELLKRIAEKCAYSYEYESLSGVLAKRTASSTETKSTERKYFAASKPSFAGGAFTGAERGTAIHKFLELCDFKKAALSIADEEKRLAGEHKMTEAELKVLDREAVSAFLTLPVGKRLLESDELLKEYEFNVLRKAGELYPDIPENVRDEQIVVQGKLDCAFIENGKAVLIDYKTDSMTDESEYVRIYRSQLEIYADALTQCRGVPVAEIYIYSFKLKKFIPVR